ncbi:DUF3800 domain-containing protein [Candidatus Shapirobacteria bacterium]|nr:DUF3800 domain-containing protein [Candidatus Shapirobacteria bacterium]
MDIKINTYTDESGQDTKWKEFVVSTIICLTKDSEIIEAKLDKAEKNSNKHQKWFKSNNQRRQEYVNQLLDNKVLLESSIYFSKYHNKTDYVSLVTSHIVKAIKSYSSETNLDIKIFIDKVDHKTLAKVKKELKLYRLKVNKIRGVRDESSSLIRLADSICGMIRDLNNPNHPDIYSRLFKKIHEI